MNTGRELSMEGHSHAHFCYGRSISFSAIIVGTLVGMGLGFLLNLFNVSLGLSAFTVSKEGLETLAVGGLVGLIIGTIVSMYISGWVAGYLARRHTHRRNMGILYGFTTWCLILLVTAIFASHIGDFLDSYHLSIINAKTEPMQMAGHEQQGMAKNAPEKQHENMMPREQAEKAEKIVRALGTSLFITFILFFIGALSACFGGYFGIRCRDEDKSESQRRV